MTRAGAGRLAAVLALAGGAFLATGFYTVPSSSVAVTRLFGAVVDPRVPPGIHWFWPRPLGRLDRVAVTTSVSVSLGQATAGEPQTVVSGLAASRWLTGDTNLVEVRAKVNYRIADPAAYLLRSDRPEDVLRDVAGSALTEVASRRPVDELLTSGRLALVEEMRLRAQTLLDAYGVGLQILAVNVEAIEPPATVIAAFQDVQNARADRERTISEAETYANGTLPLARGEAERKVREAEGFREQRVNAAQGDAEAFRRLAAEHRRAPGLLEQRLYLEAVEKILPRVRRYVLSPGGAGALPLRIVE